MRKIFFCLLLLSFIFFLACKPTATDDGKAGLRGPKPDQKSVAIVIFQDKDGKRWIKAIPETVLVMKGRQKVQFSAHNNLDQDLEYVDIDFGAEEPLDGGKKIRIEGIFNGDKDDRTSGKAKGDIGKSYKYTVRAKVKGEANEITPPLDPQVEISGGL